MDPGGLRQGKVRSQEVTTSTLDTPSTSRSISPEKSAQIFTQLGRFCMGALDVVFFIIPGMGRVRAAAIGRSTTNGRRRRLRRG